MSSHESKILVTVTGRRQIISPGLFTVTSLAYQGDVLDKMICLCGWNSL